MHFSLPIIICVGLIALSLLVFGMAMVLILRAGICPREVPLAISPDSAKRHLAMIWLVRAGEALIMGPLTLLLLMIGVGFVLSLYPFKPVEVPSPPVASEIYSVVMLIIILLVGFFIGRKLIGRLAQLDRHSFYKKFLRVTSNSVSTFSMVFAALAAHDVYQLMPAKHQVPGHGVSLFKVFILDRSMVWPIVFFGLWRLVYVVLLRVMEMNPPKYPQNVAYPPPPDPEAPEFPQKSPLIQM